MNLSLIICTLKGHLRGRVLIYTDQTTELEQPVMVCPRCLTVYVPNWNTIGQIN